MKKEYIIPIFVPYIDKQNICTLFNSKLVDEDLEQLTKSKVKEIIDKYLKVFNDNNEYVEVAFLGECFTNLEETHQMNLLEAVNGYIKEKKVNSIRIIANPKHINKDYIKRIKKYGVRTIELKVYSSNNYILQQFGCEYSFEDIKKAAKKIRWKRLILGFQMLIGLPDSTSLDEINTAKQLIKLKPKLIRIEEVLVIKDTILEQKYKNNEYIPITVEQAVERCKEIVDLFNKNRIDTIRIGYQNTEEIVTKMQDKSKIIAGPYHPAFRQVVENKLWYDSIVEKIKKVNAKVRQIKIIANPENINSIMGEKNENIIKLKEVYELDTTIESNEEIRPGEFKIEIEKLY